MLAIERDAHWQSLMVAVMLEERLSGWPTPSAGNTPAAATALVAADALVAPDRDDLGPLDNERGSLLAAHSGNWPTATERRDEPTTPPWEVMLLQLEHKSSYPLSGFVEIVRSLQGEHSLQIVNNVHPEDTEESYEAVGSSIMATQLFWHPTSGEMYIDMLTCMLSVVDLGVDPMAEVHLFPAL